MSNFVYKPTGVCSKEIRFDIDNDIVTNVRFIGGCSGNAKGISSLCENMNRYDIISKLSGIKCGCKETSCPDQLAKALKETKNE